MAAELDAGGWVRILEADPDLGLGLDEQEFAAAREALRARELLLAGPRLVGQWGPDAHDTLGLLVVSGVLTREVSTAGSTAAELLAAGDLIRPAVQDGEQ